MTDLRDLLSRANGLPWAARHDLEWGSSSILGSGESRPVIADVLRSWDGRAHNDADLIVAAVNALPNLLSELDGARERIAELEAVLAGILPSKLCGESWGLPDDETVSIVVTFGALARARALGEKKS